MLGVGVTSDKQLFQMADKLRIKINKINFKDKLGDKPIDGNYIINMASSFDSMGTHWLGLYINNNEAYYFDSFGFSTTDGSKRFY